MTFNISKNYRYLPIMSTTELKKLDPSNHWGIPAEKNCRGDSLLDYRKITDGNPFETGIWVFRETTTTTASYSGCDANMSEEKKYSYDAINLTKIEDIKKYFLSHGYITKADGTKDALGGAYVTTAGRVHYDNESNIWK